MESHRLKSWPPFFEAIVRGNKRHELRRSDDRTFQVGDVLLLEEYDPQSNTYTGRQIQVEVTYITSLENPCALSPDALNPCYSILSIRPVN
jgi:hypothetical protein